jgi:sugar phosphate isomerase/epimerase
MARSLVGYSLIADAFDFSDFPAALDEAEALGVDSVELPVFAMHLIAGGRLVEPRVDRFAAVLAGRRFAISVHGPLGINLMDRAELLPRHEAVARASIAVAARFGARHLVIHTGRVAPADLPDMEAAYARQRAALVRLGDVAGAAGVTLCVENVFRYSGLETATPSRLAAELEAVAHPAVAACFDVGHGAIRAAEAGLDPFAEAAGLDPFAEAAALAPFARHVHVHDNFGRPMGLGTFHPSEALAFGDGDLHLPLGWGDLPWADLLAGAGFPRDCWLNLELNARYWPELPACIARLKALSALTGG